MNKKRIQTVKIVIFVLVVLILAILAEYLFEYFSVESKDELSFFARHLSLGFGLILVGIIAGILPFLTRTRYGDGKGDNMMVVVAMLLILVGIVSIPLTFLLPEIF